MGYMNSMFAEHDLAPMLTALWNAMHVMSARGELSRHYVDGYEDALLAIGTAAGLSVPAAKGGTFEKIRSHRQLSQSDRHAGHA
jgi:hypothetical protein